VSGETFSTDKIVNSSTNRLRRKASRQCFSILRESRSLSKRKCHGPIPSLTAQCASGAANRRSEGPSEDCPRLAPR
jgi:hypothetical protein